MTVSDRILPSPNFRACLTTTLVFVVMMRTLAAGADVCKVPGESCRTTKSCCTGVCVKGVTPFGKCCTPTTCQATAANCGIIANGDCAGLTLNCGTCTDPETCGGGGTPNVCGTSTTSTMATTTTTTSTTTTTMPCSGVDCSGKCCLPGESCVATSVGPVCNCLTPNTLCGFTIIGEGVICDQFHPCTCSDLQTDLNNCGTCGNVCATGSDCQQGTCVKTCRNDDDCPGQFCCTYQESLNGVCPYALHCADRLPDNANGCQRRAQCQNGCCCYEIICLDNPPSEGLVTQCRGFTLDNSCATGICGE